MIERAAIKTPFDVIPTYSQFGYIIDEKGDVYTLTSKFLHGFVLALLYPQALEEFRKTEMGIELGDRLVTDHLASIQDVDVFAFQAFELQWHGQLPAIRVCGMRVMSGHPSVDLPEKCTVAQTTALRHVFRALNATSNTTVEMDVRDTTVVKCLAEAINRVQTQDA